MNTIANTTIASMISISGLMSLRILFVVKPRQAPTAKSKNGFENKSMSIDAGANAMP